MFRKLAIVCAMVMVFAFSASAMAQDVFHLEGTANGDSPPVTLAPETEYEFAFDVFNDAGGDVAIKAVAITLPTIAYVIGDFTETFPGIHDDFEWEAEYDEDTGTMLWEAFGSASSAEMGDIAEGDMLTFKFFATTDESGSDNFSWMITGDDNGATTAAGVFSFSGEVDDDDDDDDEDDDDDGGCGC